jgi:hypothetical protein
VRAGKVVDGWGLGFYLPGSNSVVMPVQECSLVSRSFMTNCYSTVCLGFVWWGYSNPVYLSSSRYVRPCGEQWSPLLCVIVGILG